MSATPTEEAHDVTGRTLDMNAEVRKIWGPEWNKPELEYEFGKRKFYRRTEESGIYRPQE